MSPERRGAHGLTGLAAGWLRRGFQIAGILWRYGFGPALRSFGLARFLPSTPEREPDVATAGMELPVRLRMACEEIGPVAIKLAQALASRPDLVPLEYAREFRRLQDHVPPFPFEEARRIVEGELHASLEELFAECDPEPAASASIGQVHFAVLPDGRRAAVKVQRPEVRKTVETDLQILGFVAREVERHVKAFRDSRISEWTDEFERSLRAELDYNNEGRSTDRLREALAEDRHVTVPSIHWEVTTGRVLTMERMDGLQVDDFAGLEAAGINRATVAAHLAQSVLRQIFVNGFFHADPHAGNLLVQHTGRVVFLDCGNTHRLSRDMREAMGRMLMAALEDDALGVCDQIIDIGVPGEDTDLQELRTDVQRAMAHYAGLSTAELNLGDVLEDIMGAIFRHRVRMPTAFASVLRALVLVEGNCRQLSPSFDFREPAQQVTREVLREWVRPDNVLRELWRAARDMHRFSVLIPRQVSELLAKAQSGGLQVKLEAAEREDLLRRADVMCNRLAFALVVAAIIVGSSVMLASERAVGLLSTPGAIAYGLIGALMGLYLLYSILMSGRL